MRTETRVGATIFAGVAVALTMTVEACNHEEETHAPPAPAHLGATSGNADYNGALMQGLHGLPRVLRTPP